MAANSQISWNAQVVSLNDYKEPNEKLTDVIKNGVLHIAPSLSSQSYYWSQFTLPMSQKFDGDNFKIEARVKNSASDGGLSAYDLSLGFSSSDTPANAAGASFMDGSWAISYTGISALGKGKNSIDGMVVSLSDWHTLGVETKNQKVITYYDGKQVGEYSYTGKIGQIDSLSISTKGSGSIDWAKATSNGTLILEDNFDATSTNLITTSNNNVSNANNVFEYNGHTYQLSKAGTWKEAQAEAKSLGGNLVTINDKAENDWLVKTFGTGNLWIGYTDEQTEGIFKWVDGSASNYTNWNAGEPNNYQGIENYGHLLADTNGKWNDLANSLVGYTPMQGIIEINKAQTTPVPVPVEKEPVKPTPVAVEPTPVVDATPVLEIGKVTGIKKIGTPDKNKQIGTEKDDYLSGLAGNDTQTGLAGNDTIDGGLGDDSLDAGAGNDVLIGGEGKDKLLGGSGNDRLDGGADNDQLTGDKGNDTLNGGVGADKMDGGEGDDYYFVDNVGDVVVENSKNAKNLALGGKDTVESTLTYTLGDNLENLILKGITEINGTGNKSDNRIEGNSADNILKGNAGNDYLLGRDGADELDGGLGMDTLDGGLGSDIYYMNNTEDKIIETEGTDDQDQVIATVSYSLDVNPNIESLTLEGKNARDATGNDLDNSLQEVEGGTTDNRFNGMGGNDTITAEGGNDTLIGGSGDDELDGGDGTDTAIFDFDSDYYQLTRNVDTEGVDQIMVEYIGNTETYDGRDTLTNIEIIQFADGETLNTRDIEIEGSGSSSSALQIELTGQHSMLA